MLISDCKIGEIYVIEDVKEGEPCQMCTPCLRLRLMEMSLLAGQKIRVDDHKLGIWIIQVLESISNNPAFTIAMRDEEAERIVLED